MTLGVIACAESTEPLDEQGSDLTDDNYGFASEPPTRALADTHYAFDLRTVTRKCATDRVEWSLVDAPDGAALLLPATSAQLTRGQKRVHEAGGPDRNAAKVIWDLGPVAPGRYAFTVSWRAWLDCGLFSRGRWGEEVKQTWSLEVVPNHWYSGDLHVHTKHSEGDASSGSVRDYYERLVNRQPDDAGRTFASRSSGSLRGRLHWLVFSEHTNNEKEECGRHFSTWCDRNEPLEQATGRDVVRQYTEESNGSALLVTGAEVSNLEGGHFGFLPRNPFPNHPIYAPNYDKDATAYDFDAGFGPGVFRERWVDPATTNQEEIALGHRMNALMIVNHPDIFPADRLKFDWSTLDFDGLEVWNGGNRHDRGDDDAYNGGLDLDRVAKGDKLRTEIPERPISHSYIGMLKHGRWPFTLVGGSDVHRYREVICGGIACDPLNQEFASPTTTVWADSFAWTNGQTGIVDGIAAGRVVVHDASNFIDLRVTYEGREYMVGDTIENYEPGAPLTMRAIGHAGPFIDGDNRVLLMLGTNRDENDPGVDVLYNSADATHFVKKAKGEDHMRYIRPETSFDRTWEARIDDQRLGSSKTFFLWSQFIPWHNLFFGFGMGRDMAETGAIRVIARGATSTH